MLSATYKCIKFEILVYLKFTFFFVFFSVSKSYGLSLFLKIGKYKLFLNKEYVFKLKGSFGFKTCEQNV